MLHSLALVEVEHGGAEHLLEPFLEVTLIDGHLPAQFLNCNRFANVLDQQFPCLYNLLAIGLVCKEFTIDRVQILLSHHALYAVEKQHLHLCIDVNIFKSVGVLVVEQGFNHHPRPAAERKHASERSTMPEVENVFSHRIAALPGLHEL